MARVRFLNADYDPLTLEQTVEGIFRHVDVGPRGCLVVTPRGAHIGFVAGPLRAPRYWAEDLAAEWLSARAR